MKAELRPGERLDDLQINDYYIIQNPDKFCFGMDAVLLSGFARAKKHENCLPLHTVHRAAKLLTLVQVPGSSQSC